MSATELHALEHDLVITFDVRRGELTVPARLLAEDADDYEVRRFFAIHLPKHEPPTILETSRQPIKGGDVLVRWRLIRTIVRRVPQSVGSGS